MARASLLKYQVVHITALFLTSLFLSARATPGSLLLLPGGKPVMDAPGPGGRGDEGGGGVHRQGEEGGELQLE